MANNDRVAQMAEYIATNYPIKGKMKLLADSSSNAKTAKNSDEYISAIMNLAPADFSGYQTCPMATLGCKTACLATAGRNSMALDDFDINRNRAAQIRKTHYFFQDREGFMNQLYSEIANIVKRANKLNKKVAIRLNGTSDIRWELYPVKGFANIMLAFPDVQFYDYTKLPNRRNIPDNYYLIFSLAESNRDSAVNALNNGMNVAAVFSAKPKGYNRYIGTFTKESEPLPDTYLGFPVVDGDKTDLRFTDERGVIVGLRVKGRAALDKTGFVQNA
jgi:Gene product 88